MKYFRLIQEGIDVQPFLDEIASVDPAWSCEANGSEGPAMQREAQVISLRGPVRSKIRTDDHPSVQQSRFTNAAMKYVRARQFLREFAEVNQCEMGRAKIICLTPGRRVYPNVDQSDHHRLSNRFHLVLHSPAGSCVKTGEEQICMRAGELWWIDNNETSETLNESTDERVHIVFDMLPLARMADVYGCLPVATDPAASSKNTSATSKGNAS